MATTIKTTTPVYTFKNKKGEVVAYNVRSQNATDAQYISGVNSTGETTNTSVTESTYLATDANGHNQ